MGNLLVSFSINKEKHYGKLSGNDISPGMVEVGEADSVILADRNNNNQRNKIFSIDVENSNCSNAAAGAAVPQQHVLHLDGLIGEQQQQDQHNPQHLQQVSGPLSAVPVHAGGTVDQPASISVISTQNLSYNTPYGGQGYPQYGTPPPAYQYQYAGQPPPVSPGQGYPQGPYLPGQGYPQGPYPPGQGYPQGPYPPGQGYPPPPPPGIYVTPSPVTFVVVKRIETPEERLRFIRGVYTVLVLQLVVCFGFVLLVNLNEDVRKAVSNPIFIIIAIAMYIGVSFSLCCLHDRMMTTNSCSVSVLIILTGSMSFLTAYIAGKEEPRIVLLALGVTLLVTLAMTMIACTCSYDFTKLTGVMFVLMILLLLFGIAAVLLRGTMPILHIIYSYLGAILFSVYIIIDTQMLMSGKEHSLSPDMVILGAILLFVDIVNLFLFLLRILSSDDGTN